MRTVNDLSRLTLVAVLGIAIPCCSGPSGGAESAGGSVGATTNGLGGESSSGTNTGQGGPGTDAAGGTETGGTEGSGDRSSTDGSRATGGAKATGGVKATGGAKATSSPSGGVPSTSTTSGKSSGGASAVSSKPGSTSAPNTSGACTVGTWSTADPSKPGPFATQMDQNVGPQAGAAEEDGTIPQFTMFRPKDLAESGLCHPVVTWGNGTGATPNMYSGLLTGLASHGFIVIASNSTNVGKGTPAPMIAGVTWVLAQNEDPTSVLYHRVDTTHVGATGHSQGGFATTTAGADANITAIAPICGASMQRNLHGPAILLCGGQDTVVPCDGMIKTAYDGITNQPVMLANYLSADHGNWLSFRAGGTLSAIETAVVAWMRVHLMDDTSLRSRFYGTDCALCQDAGWQISQKMMDP